MGGIIPNKLKSEVCVKPINPYLGKAGFNRLKGLIVITFTNTARMIPTGLSS